MCFRCSKRLSHLILDKQKEKKEKTHFLVQNIVIGNGQVVPLRWCGSLQIMKGCLIILASISSWISRVDIFYYFCWFSNPNSLSYIHLWWNQICLMCRYFPYQVLWLDLNYIRWNDRTSTTFLKISFWISEKSSHICFCLNKHQNPPCHFCFKKNGQRNNSIFFLFFWPYHTYILQHDSKQTYFHTLTHQHDSKHTDLPNLNSSAWQ